MKNTGASFLTKDPPLTYLTSEEVLAAGKLGLADATAVADLGFVRKYITGVARDIIRRDGATDHQRKTIHEILVLAQDLWMETERIKP